MPHYYSMNTQCFGFVGFPIWALLLVVASAVAVYLFLRANPKKKAKLDAAVSKVEEKLKK